MAPKRGYYKRKRYGRRPSKKSKTSKKLATRAYVKRICARDAEKKYFTRFTYNQPCRIQVNSAPVLDEGFFSLVPAIGLGNTSGGRIANRCKVVKSRLNMTLSLLPYVAVTNPYTPSVYVKIWIFRFKPANDRQPTLSEWQSFFKGNGSNYATQGNLLDLNSSVETDIYDIVKTKTVFLTSTSNSANGVPNATSYMFASGKNAINLSFDITKHLGTMTYNDASTSSILGKNLWCFIQPIYTQYNPSTGNAFTPVSVTYAQNTWYEDC